MASCTRRTAAIDRVKKLTIYAREHVAYAWLVDPAARTLEVLHLDDGRWTIVSTSAGATSCARNRSMRSSST